jgi:hypothetical protein
MNSLEKEVCTELCKGEARSGNVWWKIGAWTLQGEREGGLRRISEHGICPMCIINWRLESHIEV